MDNVTALCSAERKMPMDIEERDAAETLKELLDTKQYTVLRQTMEDMQDADIAAVMDEMEDEDTLKMFRLLPKDMAADVFAQLEIDAQQYIIQSLSESESASVIDNLMADDATDLLEEMPANVVRKILANAKPETREAGDKSGYQPSDAVSGGLGRQHYDGRVRGPEGGDDGRGCNRAHPDDRT